MATDPARELSLENFIELMKRANVSQILVKDLAPNDNSKNQPYVARGSLDAINILPAKEFRPERTEKGRTTLKAALEFGWLQLDGSVLPAPHAQLILYPQYPEIRLSGFLRGAIGAPNGVMNTREEGRLLFLGITTDRRIVAWASFRGSKLAQAYKTLLPLDKIGVFGVLPLNLRNLGVSSRSLLLRELRRIHQLGWINSKALNRNGRLVSCTAAQCIGYTLEAEFGIARNGRAEPDFNGWEIKASKVVGLNQPIGSKPITLMTPEPTGGYYRDHGVIKFIRRFGYKDKLGRDDRWNFGGIFRVGERHQGTSLTLQLEGFDSDKRALTNIGGSIALVDDNGAIAAEWSFASLMTLWNRKHAQAVYVPGEERNTPCKQYRYASTVRCGEGTDFIKLLSALSIGAVYYDPGIKLENASTKTPVTKRRSQFRVKSKDIASLYSTMSEVSVL